MNDKKLYRDDQHKMIGGVCKGLADYFDIDVTLVRAVFLLALVLKGGGVLIYIVVMIILCHRKASPPIRSFTSRHPAAKATLVWWPVWCSSF
jgi:phage shock protein PspC (stress-responsive transcriptional regulator)